MMGFVEEQAELGEDDPQLLPPVRILELPQQVPAHVVAQRHHVVAARHRRVPMPTHVHGRVGALLLL